MAIRSKEYTQLNRRLWVTDTFMVFMGGLALRVAAEAWTDWVLWLLTVTYCILLGANLLISVRLRNTQLQLDEVKEI